MKPRITRKRREEDIETLEGSIRKHSQWGDVVRRLLRNRLAMVGLVICVLIIFSAIFANVLTPYDYSLQDFDIRLQLPSAAHPLGTDNFGRDLLARLLYGGRISLLVALLAVCISMVTGALLGAVAGYFGGTCELIIMRVMDVLMAIPSLLMAVAISSALGSGIFNTALACAVSGIPSSTRILRATILSIREQEFVEAAKATGSSNARIIFVHILPNTLAPLIVDATLRIGGTIMAISGLSFVGLGVQPPTPEWGSILATSREYIRDFYPLVVFPGIMIMLTLFGFNLLGDGIRDALDPKLKQ